MLLKFGGLDSFYAGLIIKIIQTQKDEIENLKEEIDYLKDFAPLTSAKKACPTAKKVEDE